MLLPLRWIWLPFSEYPERTKRLVSLSPLGQLLVIIWGDLGTQQQCVYKCNPVLDGRRPRGKLGYSEAIEEDLEYNIDPYTGPYADVNGHTADQVLKWDR